MGETGLDGAAVVELLRSADVVIDDHSLAYWLERGLNLKQLYETEPPHATWCAITAYGLVGAGGGFAGCELTYQASGPLMYRIGSAGRPPLPLKGPHAEMGAAWHAAAVIAAAEVGRPSGGAGSLIDVSVQETQYMHLDHGAANWYFNGVEITRVPSSRQNSSLFPTLDGPVFMLYHDREWPRVARMIDRPDLAHDARFMTRYDRAKHLDELDALLTPWFMERTRSEAVEAGQAAGMPLALSQTMTDVLADPQLAYRGALETLRLDTGEVTFPTGVGWLRGHDLARQRTEKDAKPPKSMDQVLAELRAQQAEAPRNGQGASNDPTKPLQGIRIVDLTNTLAAPRAATILGSLGAEVIKVEGIEWMDMLRGYTTPPATHPGYPEGIPGDEPWNRWLQWLSLGRNKLSVGVELTRPEGLAILEDLTAISDVVMTNMSKSTRAKYNLNYEHLAELNPKIIFATLSAYGDDGPRSEWRLFGDGQASMAGLFSGTGYEGEESLSFGPYGDPINGTALAFQIVEALLQRQQTGRGGHVDVSAVETCASFNCRSFVEAALGEDAEAPVGFDALGRWPHGVFRCLGEERWVAISCGTDEQRQQLVAGLRELGVDGSATEAAIVDGASKAEAWQELLNTVCGRNEAAIVEKALQIRGVPSQEVMRGRDADGDSLLSSRDFINWLWREDLGTYPVYAAFWLIQNQRPAITHEPPLLGEDNEYVLRGLLHKSEQEVDKLQRKGVVGDTPLMGAELGIRPVASNT
jgi:crotonobetainyl-CoA:carnitine CoA-transferase CaiB-like acyl-CoA transferase